MTAAGLAVAVVTSGCGFTGDTSTDTSTDGAVRQRPAAPAPATPGLVSGSSSWSAASSRETLAAAVVQRQVRALRERDRRGFLADWLDAPATQRAASDAYANLVALGVVIAGSRLTSNATSRHADTWSIGIDVSWRAAGFDASPSSSVLVYRFADSGGRALLTGIETADHARLPIWLLPALEVRRSPRTLVATADETTATRLSRLLRSAVAAVGDVLPGWHGRLVGYEPSTPRQFAALVGATVYDDAGIAAVTTTVDGSHAASTPVAIVVNPAVFDTLGPVGAHVVVAHEATHAATGAATVDMPLWVAEGFADYVGIGAVAVPTPVAASAALRLVRRQDAPARLPDDASFAIRGASLEATYEQAWLAATLIARRHGRSALVAFYREVQAHPDGIDAAFSSVLHTSRAAFTQSWRRNLERLARDG